MQFNHTFIELVGLLVVLTLSKAANVTLTSTPLKFQDPDSAPFVQSAADNGNWATRSSSESLQGPHCKKEDCASDKFFYVAVDGTYNAGDQVLMYTQDAYTSPSSCITVAMWYNSNKTDPDTLAIVYRKYGESTWNKAWSGPKAMLDWEYAQVDILHDNIEVGFQVLLTNKGKAGAHYALDNITIMDCKQKQYRERPDHQRYTKKREGRTQWHDYILYSNGEFASHHYPNNYLHDYLYVYEILAKQNASIHIKVDDFHTEKNVDFLKVFDIQYEEQILLAQYSGNISGGFSLTTTSPYLKLEFHSSIKDNQYKGFELKWFAVDASGKELPADEPAPKPNYSTSSGFSAGAIVGICAGTFAWMPGTFYWLHRRRGRNRRGCGQPAAPGTSATASGAPPAGAPPSDAPAQLHMEKETGHGTGGADQGAPPSYDDKMSQQNQYNTSAQYNTSYGFDNQARMTPVEPGTAMPPPPAYESMYVSG